MAIASANAVVPKPATNHVVTAKPNNDIISWCTNQHIVPIGPNDCRNPAQTQVIARLPRRRRGGSGKHCRDHEPNEEGPICGRRWTGLDA